jgi:hypothetical protein
MMKTNEEMKMINKLYSDFGIKVTDLQYVKSGNRHQARFRLVMPQFDKSILVKTDWYSSEEAAFRSAENLANQEAHFLFFTLSSYKTAEDKFGVYHAQEYGEFGISRYVNSPRTWG